MKTLPYLIGVLCSTGSGLVLVFVLFMVARCERTPEEIICQHGDILLCGIGLILLGGGLAWLLPNER